MSQDIGFQSKYPEVYSAMVRLHDAMQNHTDELDMLVFVSEQRDLDNDGTINSVMLARAKDTSTLGVHLGLYAKDRPSHTHIIKMAAGTIEM
jgi:hypothetical protein